MFDPRAFDRQQREWLAQQFEAIPTTVTSLRPSEWAEAKRYLPDGTSPLPGHYRFDVTPYLREIVDCFDLASPIRHVSLMKGVALGFTVGVLENLIGYLIDHVRTAPAMWVTADAELAQNRLGSYVIPMLDHSGLSHLIRSADEGNARKTGRTDKKLEWEGGGFLLPLGAQNEAKLRSTHVEWLLRDENDGWPLVVGRDGDPHKLSWDRTASFEHTRKVLDGSTPTISGQSRISELFLQGDQRHYYVCCLSCGYAQVLRWRHQDADGVVSGMYWRMEQGRLVPGSVRYLCQKCQHPHTNDDKTRLLDPANGAEWRPHAQPSNPYHRSYHLSALYSPPGMQSWETCVQKWLAAWDVENDRANDHSALQVFYNNVLGETFELRGEKVRLDAVSAHRRSVYRFGEVPNAFAEKHCTSPILLVTGAVDVHGDNLATAYFGWTRDRRCFLLDYRRLEGDTDQLDNPATWGELRELIENRVFVADDGKRYRTQLTFVDSGYRPDHAYRFCAEYSYGVHPVKGEHSSSKNFRPLTTSTGVSGFLIKVDHYKDRLSSVLRREWDGFSVQAPGHFNAPVDVTEKQLRELTVESKVAKQGSTSGYTWRRPSGAANELWDLLVYSSAALDIIADDVCRNVLRLESIDWSAFWDYAEDSAPYYESP